MSKAANKRDIAKHIHRIPFNIQNSEYDVIKKYCDEHDIPVATFIKKCISEYLYAEGIEIFRKAVDFPDL